MKNFGQRVWHSPTLMTWLNTSARMLALAVVMPLVLRQFAPADIALYYLFATIVSLQLMAASGFTPTFARFISYVVAGATQRDLEASAYGQTGPMRAEKVDPVLLERLVRTMSRVFLIVALLSIPLMGVIGTLVLRRPVGLSANPTGAWAAWTCIVMITPVVISGCRYGAFLQGVNWIALQQRWSAVFAICGSISGLIVLLWGGGLFELIAANQAWQIVSFLWMRVLARRAQARYPHTGDRVGYCPEIFRAIWPSSWRSLVGVVSYSGVTAAGSLVFAQFLGAIALAELLFGIRAMSIISEMCRAPFYSRIPVFNMLRAKAQNKELEQVAKRGMRISYVAFVGLSLCAPVVANFILPLIGSRIAFSPLGFWLLLGLASLVERFGAMHLQLYSSTNHIIWHWLNGGAGILWLGIMAILFPFMGINAYPLSMLVAMAGFYSWISARFSLRSLGQKFFRFERSALIPALAVQLAGSGLLWCFFHP